MVCEICGSQSIRKENGIFVCQECGTEYSSDDAKTLLKEVGNDSLTKSQASSTNSDYSLDIASLKEQLLLWVNITHFYDSINNVIFDFKLNDSGFWTKSFIFSLKTLSDGTFYGACCNSWPSAPKPYDKNYLIRNSLNINEVIEDVTKQKKEADDALTGSLPSSHKLLYSEVSEKYGRIIERLRTVSQIDVDLSRSFWMNEMTNLIKDKFCFAEIAQLTTSDIDLCSCVLNYNNYVNLNNPNVLDYYQYLSRNYLEYKTRDDRPFKVKQSFFGGIKKIFFYNDFDFDGLHIKIVNKFNEIKDKYKNYYQKFMIPHLEEYRKMALEYLDTAIELEKAFFLPYQYRNSAFILEMIEMLETGKANSWKELVNLFDTNLYREKVLSSLEQINTKLEQIESTLKQTNTMLFETNNHLKNIDDKLKDLNHSAHLLINKTEQIRKTSFITMYESLEV